MAIVYVIAADPTDKAYCFPFADEFFLFHPKGMPDEDFTTIEVEEPSKDKNNPAPRKVKRKIDPLRIGVLAHRPVEWTVDRIIEMVTDNKVKINLLRICCHGETGQLYLGNRPKGIQIEMLEPFRKLKPHFATGPGARREIKIHACGVASDTPVGADPRVLTCVREGKCSVNDLHIVPGTFKHPSQMKRSWIAELFGGKEHKRGLEFMEAIAELTGASVQAAINVQSADLTYRGPTIFVFPPPGGGFVELDYDNSGQMGEFVNDPKTGQPVFRRYSIPVPPPPGLNFDEAADIERQALELIEKARQVTPQRGNVRKGNENTLKPKKKKR